MIDSVGDWALLLRRSDPLVGIPLLIGGVGLMAFGWRLWRVCVVLSYALIGLALGGACAPAADQQSYYAIGAGVVLAAAAYRPVKYSIAGLGGIIGAALMMYFLDGLRISGPTLWILGSVAFIGASALAFLNRRLVVIGVTAALGAALTLSGLTAFLAASPSAYGTVASLIDSSGIIMPFIFLVPVVVSCFFQEAEVHRLRVEI
ncbi:MAG: hypothetical protein JSU63_06880 [Phycisphaerales bacterium]|nr:MAG: hypothetical protein JSU63_06880 [Phycisphaerales bacterium]